MFIRFETYQKNDEANSRLGVFQAAYELRDTGKLEGHELDWLRESLGWLERNLELPKVLSNEGTQRAISWFRSTANEPIQKVRDMAALLEVNDVHVRMVKTNDPGTVIYEDDWQVVAVPRKRKKRK